MTGSQHDRGTLYKRIAHIHTGHAPADDLETRDLMVEQYASARLGNRAAYIGYYTRQLVGADMRMRLEEYLGVGAVKDKRLQRLVVVASFLAARKELAVRKGARTALAESIVRIGIDSAVAVDLRYVVLARQDGLTAFEHYRSVSRLDKSQSGEESRRPRTYDDYLRAAVDRRIVEVHRLRLRLGVDIYFEC